MDSSQWLAGPEIPFGISIIILAASLWFASRGRLGLIAGIYWVCVTQLPPTFVVVPGMSPIAGSYIFLGFLALASLVYMSGRKVRVTLRGVGPLTLWLLLWFFWMVVILAAFPPNRDNAQTAISLVGLRIFAPLVVIALFGDDFDSLREFAWAFILTNLALLPHTLFALYNATTLNELLPAVVSAPWRDVTHAMYNYHVMGQAGTITAILCIILLTERGRQGVPLTTALLLALAISTSQVILSSSRQHMVALLAGVFIFVISFFGRQRSRHRYAPFLAIAGCLAIFAVLYSLAPSYFRLNEDLVYDSSGALTLASRAEIFTRMWAWFLKSPIIGNGVFYQDLLSHDIFLDALAGQGIPGFVFFCGLLVGIMRFVRGTWSLSSPGTMVAWRTFAFILWAIGLMTASVSGSVLSADVLYVASMLIWRTGAAASRGVVSQRLGGRATGRLRLFPSHGVHRSPVR